MWVWAVAASYTIAPSDSGAVFGRGCLSGGWGFDPAIGIHGIRKPHANAKEDSGDTGTPYLHGLFSGRALFEMRMILFYLAEDFSRHSSHYWMLRGVFERFPLKNCEQMRSRRSGEKQRRIMKRELCRLKSFAPDARPPAAYWQSLGFEKT